MRRAGTLLALALAMALSGCAALLAQERIAIGPEAVPADLRLGLRLTVVGTRGTRLLIYGGPDREVFLGCLSCERRSWQSIFHVEGPYGSVDHDASLWNPRGPYGDPKSPYSPWNRSAKHPPLLKDEFDRPYGLLTANARLRERNTDPAIVRFVQDQAERQALAR